MNYRLKKNSFDERREESQPRPMTNSRPPFFKRKYFLGSPVQKIFLIYSLAMGFLSILLMRVSDAVLIRAQENGTLVTVTAGVFLIFSIYIGIGLLISNRIAGPLFRIENELREYIKSGDLKSIRIRKGDLFSDLNQLINEALNKSQKK